MFRSLYFYETVWRGLDLNRSAGALSGTCFHQEPTGRNMKIHDAILPERSYEDVIHQYFERWFPVSKV